MLYKISKPTKDLKGTIHVPFSKSESNRLLIIKALCNDSFEIKNLSDSDDTLTLHKILQSETRNPESEIVHDVGNAGTTMRFLTAYFATQPGTRILTGTERMKQRPIKILVDALKTLGAKIEYLEKPGFPPLKIEGTNFKGGEITIEGNESSQYISALLLIAPSLPEGLTINFSGKLTSRPYIRMTLKMMEKFGIEYLDNRDKIVFLPQKYQPVNQGMGCEVEADWSSASYWYAMAALSKDTDLKLVGLKKNSLQGDSIITDMFTLFGVKTEYLEDGVRLTKLRKKVYEFVFDFSDCPDIAQTIAVVTAALKIPCLLNGLHTLKIKETDRVLALCQEMAKVGVKINQYNESLEIPMSYIFHPPASGISTYNDHRMAMAFAPLALMFDKIKIENPEVVTKSYPHFWDDMKAVGFEITGE